MYTNVDGRRGGRVGGGAGEQAGFMAPVERAAEHSEDADCLLTVLAAPQYARGVCAHHCICAQCIHLRGMSTFVCLCACLDACTSV